MTVLLFQLVDGRVRPYLRDGLAAFGHSLPVLSQTPNPRPSDDRLVVCSQIEARMVERVMTQALVRVRVLDPDQRRAGDVTGLCVSLLLAAHTKTQFAVSDFKGPSLYQDPDDTNLAGYQFTCSASMRAEPFQTIANPSNQGVKL